MVLSGVVLLLVILVVGSVLLYQRIDAFDKSVSSASTLSSALWGPLGGKDRVNVLIIGYSGDPTHGGTYLADSLNILSIDPATQKTTLIPIPRDLWIHGSKHLTNGKVNLAFALGWEAGGWRRAGETQAAVVAEVTGLRIDHWISIDFSGFSRMVDAVGGVTVTNPTAFKYTWSEQNFAAQRWTGGAFAKGTLHLNGTQALDYARVRYTSVPSESSDFARSVRQQLVLASLRDDIGSGLGALGPGLEMMDAVKGHLKTDLSAVDLLLLSGHLHPDRRLELKEGLILVAGRNSEGSYILSPIGARSAGDYAPLRRFIATQLAKPIPAAPSPSPTPRS